MRDIEVKESRLSTTRGREYAYLLKAKRQNRAKAGYWHVGITTQEHFWLDLHTKSKEVARELAQMITNILKTPTSIYETGKSFWLVNWRQLSPEFFKVLYECLEKTQSPEEVDMDYVHICIKYGKATLRVDDKIGQPRPRKIEVIELNPSRSGM